MEKNIFGIVILTCVLISCTNVPENKKIAQEINVDEKTTHLQERIIETIDHNGLVVDVVEWKDTIWCGKVGYAEDNTGEPDVDKIMSGFQTVVSKHVNERIEGDWDVCISINYLSSERPNGVMFGFLVGTDQQLSDYDIYKVPAQMFMRIRMSEETAKILGHEPWRGGIPPYEWIGEQIAPKYGYKYADDTKPVFEYYGFYNHQNGAHEFCYLYVPVVKREN